MGEERGEPRFEKTVVVSRKATIKMWFRYIEPSSNGIVKIAMRMMKDQTVYGFCSRVEIVAE